MIKVEDKQVMNSHAVKRKAEFNQKTNVKKLKTEDNKLNNVANVVLTVRQIESLEKMAMFRKEHWPKKKKINSLSKC